MLITHGATTDEVELVGYMIDMYMTTCRCETLYINFLLINLTIIIITGYLVIP